MIISSQMDLDKLGERMSGTVTVPLSDIEAMRDMLVAEFDGVDIHEVPEADWSRMLESL